MSEVNEVQSSVYSCRKCIFTLGVKTNDSLKVKRNIAIITNCEASSNSKGKIKEEELTTSDHVIVREASNLEAEVESAGALEWTINAKGF